MSLATPQTVTYDAVGKTLNRITSDKTSSVYTDSTAEFTLKVSHQESKTRTRHLVRLDRKIVAADPLTAVNAYQTSGVYVVVDEPIFGFSDDDLDKQVDALVAWLSPANISAILANRH